MANELIMWAGRTLSGVDRFGKWVQTSLEGWWDSPDVKGEEVDRPNGDGEYDLPVYNQARHITVTGNFHAKHHDDLHQAGNILTAAMAGRFQVSGHGPTQWADVKRNSATKFTPVTDTFAQWQVRLKAVDSRKYGGYQEFVVTNGTTSAYHWGNTDAYPMVVIRGAAANGYFINGPSGKQYKVTAPVVDGRPHRIDFNDGLIRVDGLYQAGKVLSADVWPIPAGQEVNFTANVINGGFVTMTVEVTDTYI